MSASDSPAGRTGRDRRAQPSQEAAAAAENPGSGQSRSPRLPPGARAPARGADPSSRPLAPVPDGSEAVPDGSEAVPDGSRAVPDRADQGSQRQPLLSTEAIDEELEKLKATSKVRKRQLKELRKAGALLGDVLARGFLTAYLLHLCAEHPRHGNEILQEIEARTEGLWAPSSGGVYTVLRKLEKRGLLEGSWEAGVTRERRVYRVTEAGRDALEEFRQLAPPRIAAASHVLEIVAADLLSGPAPPS